LVSISGLIASAGLNCANCSFWRRPIISTPWRSTSNVPRVFIRLMVNLIFVEDDDVLAKPGVVRTIYDPTAGTGGMLSVAGE
jgi:hypothetical protein